MGGTVLKVSEILSARAKILKGEQPYPSKLRASVRSDDPACSEERGEA